MKSLRVWLTGIALGAAMMCSVPSAKAQVQTGVPSGFTYQGVIEENGAPVTGNVTLTISLSTTAGGTVLYIETFQNVSVVNGVFNVVIGGSTPFPATMTFNQQYFMTVVVTDANGMVTLPPTALWSAPYSLNSNTVNGIGASSTPVAGELFPVPIGTGYSGSAKMDPAFLPTGGVPNDILATPDIITINGVDPNAQDNFNIVGGNGITVTSGTNGITISGSNSSGSDIIGNNSSSAVSLTVINSETNGNDALLVRGGIGANNTNGTADGTGLSPGSPQTYWADQISVPAVTGTSLQIYNTLVSTGSTIILTPFELSATTAQFAIIAQGSGTFTVSSTAIMGTGGGGSVTALNYLVINH
jgi:hypothetical protein